MNRQSGPFSRLLKRSGGIDSHIVDLHDRFSALEFADRPTALPVPLATPATTTQEAGGRSRRWILWLLLLLLLLLVVLAPSFFRYRWYAFIIPNKSFEEETVSRMLEAVSYRADGTDVISGTTGRTESTESFSYVAPDQIRTANKKLFLEGAEQATGECADLEIVLLGTTRYQSCHDKGWPARGWQQDTIDFKWTDLTLLRPWLRYSWCSDSIEIPDREVVRDVETVAYTCAVPPSRELGVIDRTNPGSLTAADRTSFLEQAKIIITIWVRQTDGYVGKFSMIKEWPGGDGTITQTVTYEYYDFQQVPAITAPK